MIPKVPRVGGLTLGALLAVSFAGIGASRAEAQWYPGGFWGPTIPYTPPSVEFLNRRAINAAGAAQAGPISGSVYGGRPNAFFNSSRDPAFFKYDIETRRALEDRVARRPSRPPATTTATATANTAAPPATTVASAAPIATFFRGSKELVWPSDAPVEGELGRKRSASDEASRVVLAETLEGGVAQLTTVSDARTKLLDYGRPALAYIRAQSTPQIAETFHRFLLSLYDSIGQAAIPPTAS